MAKYKVDFTFERIVEANDFDEAEDIAVEQLDNEIELFGDIWPADKITVEVI